jgi:phosphatidate cytidylyltransferase
MVICIITDTFAMLTGMLIGKHKACPKISPKKTIEGCVGGSIIGTAVSTIFYVNLVGKFSVKLVLITLILTVIGQLGDLFFSKIKRENQIKDFSNIMPGHGGVLDRLDSLCFVIMAYMLFISFI